MLVDAYRDMYESGRMTGKYKKFDMGKINYTFALGNKKLYDWMDHNPAIASCSVGYVNHPTQLCQIDNLVSINQALQVIFTARLMLRAPDSSKYPEMAVCRTLSSGHSGPKADAVSFVCRQPIPTKMARLCPGSFEF